MVSKKTNDQKVSDLLALHKPDQHERMRYLLGKFKPDELAEILESLRGVPPRRQIQILEDTLRAVGIPVDPEPSFLSKLWLAGLLLVWSPLSLLFGIVEAVAKFFLALNALFKLMIAGGVVLGWMALMSPVPFVPPKGSITMPAPFPYNEAMHAVIHRAEEYAAARLAPPEEPFKMHKLSRESEIVLEKMSNLQSASIELWPSTTSDKTARMHTDTIADIIDVFSSGVQQSLYDLDGSISNTMLAMSTRINESTLALQQAATLPAADFLLQHGHGPSPRSRYNHLVDYIFGPEAAPGASANATRDWLLWEDVCDAQDKLVRIGTKLAGETKGAADALAGINKQFRKVHKAMEGEVSSRMAGSKKEMDGVRAAFNETVQAWEKSRMNRWRASEWIVLSVVGTTFGGKHSPVFPETLMQDPARVRREMELLNGHLQVTHAHVRFLSSCVTKATSLLKNTSEKGKDAGPNMAAAMCKNWGEAEKMTVSKAATPYHVLEFLAEVANDFTVEMRRWDEREFHDYIQDLLELN